ncbi:MAG: hypothetical protein AB2L14_10500 [Candidatus Xenobiia bacterium LiM19]
MTVTSFHYIGNGSRASTAAEEETGKLTLFRGQGCEKCRYTGFRGRTGLFEIMIPDLDIRDLIASGFQLEQLKEILVEKDFITLKEKALFYALSGITNARRGSESQLLICPAIDNLQGGKRNDYQIIEEEPVRAVTTMRSWSRKDSTGRLKRWRRKHMSRLRKC